MEIDSSLLVKTLISAMNRLFPNDLLETLLNHIIAALISWHGAISMIILIENPHNYCYISKPLKMAMKHQFHLSVQTMKISLKPK